MKELERLRWRCRRGMLELDIVLARFVERHYASLDEDGRMAFDALLKLPDALLWDMVADRQHAAQSELQAVLEKLKAV